MGNKLERLFVKLKREYDYLRSKRIPILFDHLPKCGGTSINMYLTNHYPSRLVYKLSGSNPKKTVDNFLKLTQSDRWQKRLISGHLAHEIQGYAHPKTMAITVFREPIDRIVSHYFYVKRHKNHYLHEKIEKDNILLREYCSLNLSPELSNWYVTHFTGLTSSEIEKEPEKSIHLAFETILKMYDLIGFQDDMQCFTKSLSKKLSIPAFPKTKSMNKTANRLKIEDLDDDARTEIAKRNALDLKLYSKLVGLKNNGIIDSSQVKI